MGASETPDRIVWVLAEALDRDHGVDWRDGGTWMPAEGCSEGQPTTGGVDHPW